MDALRSHLLAAAQAAAPVRIAYHGGSQPGAAREIVPLVVGDALVLADDRATDELRAFRLSLVELLAPDAVAPPYDPARRSTPEPEPTIPELFGPARSELEAMGWHVQIAPSEITLHTFLKNGKPRKGEDVGLWFSPMTTDFFDDGDGRGMQEVERPSKRPYAVRSTSMPTVALATLARAAVRFWEQARARAPRAGIL